MGRRKVIDRATTMAAIETVVRTQGLAGLSIDAVAKEAGISKSSVLYDFTSKNALLAAFIHDRIDTKRQQIAEARQQHLGQDNAWLRGLVAQIAAAPSQEDMDTAAIIAAGMGSGDECRAVMRQTVAEDLAMVAGEATNPRTALLSYLAIYGLLKMECFGFHRFPPDERDRILRDILWLMTARPEPDSDTDTDTDTV